MVYTYVDFRVPKNCEDGVFLVKQIVETEMVDIFSIVVHCMLFNGSVNTGVFPALELQVCSEKSACFSLHHP